MSELILLKMKDKPPGFLHSWLIGKKMRNEGDGWWVTEGCWVYEGLNKDGILHNYVTDDLISQGEFFVAVGEVSLYRDVEDGDKAKVEYEKARKRWDFAKSGLISPDNGSKQTSANGLV